MSIGTCRRCGLQPRRVHHGTIEPLCQACYRDAMDAVARDLAERAETIGRRRFGNPKQTPGVPATDPTPRVTQAAPASPRAVADKAPGPENQPRPKRPPLRCISEELLGEARQLYATGLSMRAVAEALLDQTNYASAHSAAVALRHQFTRRGWPLRTKTPATRGMRDGGALRRAA